MFQIITEVLRRVWISYKTEKKDWIFCDVRLGDQ